MCAYNADGHGAETVEKRGFAENRPLIVLGRVQGAPHRYSTACHRGACRLRDDSPLHVTKGPCAGCPQDINHDNVVNPVDLAMLLGA